MENGNDVFELLLRQRRERELEVIAACNEQTARFGLALSGEEVKELAARRDESLRRWKRVEFGQGILDKLIRAFCDSAYLDQDNYAQALERLQEIFYEFKNETQDQMTDDELLGFMREQFEEVCFGDLDYLESTCLERLAAGVRAGYGGHKAADGRGIYQDFDEEMRWDGDLYMEVLRDLF